MIQHRAIRDVNREIAHFDETKPTIFIDVDGVINALPFERKWVGPEVPKETGLYDPLYYDPNNWELVRLEHDPELHYPISKEFHVDFDTWFEYDEKYIEEYLSKNSNKPRYKALRLNLMEEMLSELRALVKEYDLQVVYLTYWRSEALRVLEPELQLGASTYLDWYTRSDLGHAKKIHAIQELYEDADIRTPFVILDDESTAGLHHESVLWQINPRFADKYPERTLKFMELNKIPKLIFQQDARWGIERADIAAIREFAKAQRA